MTEQTLRAIATPGGVRFSITLDAGRVDLDLVPYSLRSPNCEAFVEGPGGSRTRIELPPAATYRGTVRGGNGSGVVAATVAGDDLRARILLEDGSDWYVEPLAGRPAGTHAVYRGKDVTEAPGACGMEDGAAAVAGERTLDRAAESAPSFGSLGEESGQLPALESPTSLEAVSAGCLEAEIAFEADYAYYVLNGASSAQTIAAIEEVMNSVELIYSRDARIGYRITHYLIQTTPGKYPSTDATQKLSEFRTWWNANQGAVPRDMTHLMVGETSGYIGYATIAVVCDRSSAYGLSRSTSSVFANRVGLTAHELGHNWGASHCNSLEDCWIMCSTINGCDKDPTRMSLGSILEIEAYRSGSASCLAAGSGTPTPLGPTARDDHAVAVRGGSVTVPVLANDFDANCQSISLGGYTATSARGGTVSPSGDALLYRAPSGFLGGDTFSYSVRDAGGTQTSATVTVDVQDWTSAEEATGAVSGLQVRYYHVPPLDQDLSRMPDLANPFRVETVPTLSFPETDGTFGESGLRDEVGARCTGTLTISQTGTYTFYLISDDGSKLYLDEMLRLDHDGTHLMSERSFTVSLEQGEHTVRVDYYDETGPSGLRLEWRRGSGARGEIPASAWGASGVRVAYYQLDSSVLPPLAALVPEGIRTVSSLDVPFSWGTFSGSGRFRDVGAVYEGWIAVPSDNVYTFELTSEDGSRLTIGDRVVVDNDGVHNRISSTGGIPLRAGSHRVRVEYFLRDQGCALTLQVSTPTMVKQVVPASWWKRMPTYHVPTSYATIAAAIAAAPSGAMVWVAPGTYTGAGNRNLDLDGKSIRLVGAGGPELTTIDAQGLGRVFQIAHHGQPAALIEGFTVTGGYAGAGGAMELDDSTLRIRNCYLQGNTSAGDGGAVRLSGNSNPIFEECVLTGNAAAGAGGAIQAEAGARPIFVGCTVAGNRSATSGGGAHASEGAAITFDRSILWGNGAGTAGADAWTADASSSIQLSCSDVNLAGVGGIGAESYGAGNEFANPRFCAPVTPSHAPTRGGGYRVAFSSPVLTSGCGTRMGALEQGCAATITAAESPEPVPVALTLRPNVPNPFNPVTRIPFALGQDGPVSLRVFDVAGRLVATLLDRSLPAGEHVVTWRGQDDRGALVSSGVYFYRLRSQEGTLSRSMVLLQ